MNNQNTKTATSPKSLIWMAVILYTGFVLYSCTKSRPHSDDHIKSIYAENEIYFNKYVSVFLRNKKLEEIRLTTLDTGYSLLFTNTDDIIEFDEELAKTELKDKLQSDLIIAEKSLHFFRSNVSDGPTNNATLPDESLKFVRFYLYRNSFLGGGFSKGIVYFHTGKPELVIENLDSIPYPIFPAVYDNDIPVHVRIDDDWYLFLENG